jgi:hypothetical protein
MMFWQIYAKAIILAKISEKIYGGLFSFQPYPKASLSHRQIPNVTDGGARKIVCYRFPLSHAMGVLTQVIKGIELS